MKMVLTRLGEDSQMVVTGDPSQSTCRAVSPVGLNEALDFSARMWKALASPASAKSDVVRHRPRRPYRRRL